MHIEILVEDSSGERLLDCLLPQILGPQGEPHTWRVHPYKGIGRIPPGLKTTADPAKRVLLDQLPKILRGYGKTPGIDALLADAIHPGGAVAVKKAGWPLPGQLKHEWAEKIGPEMNIEHNASPSFCKLREGLRRLIGETP